MASLSNGYMEKWKVAVSAMGIPEEFYSNLNVRRLDGKSKSDYSLAVIFNPGRINRPTQNNGVVNCHMCRMANEALNEPVKNLYPNSFQDMIVTPNGFPPSIGASMIIPIKEIPMYSTKNLTNLGENGENLARLLKFTGDNGLFLYHQTFGAGATIPIHEHFHGTTLYKFQESIGEFGFDKENLEPVKRNKGVYTMPNFPFAHLVFDKEDPLKIVNFIKNLNELPSPFETGEVPHTMSEGNKGILIVPTRIDVLRSMGSERAPGYFFVGSLEDFNATTYESAMGFMKERFFSKEISLEKLI
ncbi:MAG: hypothetical protein WC867_05190 [Candidatus Pacearchaeota archaeon]|jgi:hypothetical protein